MTTERLHESMDEWNKKVAAAEQMIPLIGLLFRERAIETSIFGRLLNNRTVINIIKCCRFARQVDAKELDVDEVYAVLRAVSDLADDLTPCHIDLGKIAVNFQRLTSGQSLTDYVRAELAQAMSGQRTDEP